MSLPRQSVRRRGATLVEFAITAPILFLVVFLGVEFTRTNMIRHTADNAAYEGARRGIVPGATSADIEAAVDEVLDTIRISGATVTVTPTVIDDDTAEVTVGVSIPLNGNSWALSIFFAGKTISSELTLARELHVTSP